MLHRTFENQAIELKKEQLTLIADFTKGLTLLDDYDNENLDRNGNTNKNDCYPSLEEKATMLLYFIVKNHSFVDGNKRIGACCFLYFLEKNGILYKNETPIIDSSTLFALTLLIAESKTEEMETIKQVVISVLNRGNLTL